MTLKDDIEKFLKEHPKARNRIHKNLALGWFLKEKYGLELSKDKMADLIHEALNIDRYWRLVMSEHKEWQDEVYRTKDVVEQKYELEVLEMESGFNQFQKQVKLL